MINSTIYLVHNRTLFSLSNLVFLWNHNYGKEQFLDEDVLLVVNNISYKYFNQSITFINVKFFKSSTSNL